MRTLWLDFETYSSVDLRKYGMHKYVESPDFEILLFAYAFDDGPVRVVDLAQGEKLPLGISVALEDPDVVKKAFNAPFELACLKRHGLKTDIRQWQCVAVHAAYLGLPRSLDEVCRVMKMGEDKAKKSTGKALIRYFCCPCKPTKTNGMKTRNTPDLVKWPQFIEYCAFDVEAEREIERRLLDLPVPQSVWEEWYLDQQINNRGALVDLEFVDKAIQAGDSMRQNLEAEAIILTGLDNPNSVTQLKDWLEEEIEEDIDTLRKEDVITLLKRTDDGIVTRVLEIRQELGKTSLRKYQALQGATCKDGRIRGTLLFYGANRTGRWAGRVFQPQNLPQNHLKDLEDVRWVVQNTDYQTMACVYPSVADVLSQLVRTAIIPKVGHKFIIADYSAVEARCIAWLADEEWRLDVFRGHGKIYEASASAAFGVPIEEITKDSPLRQQGKVLELACLAEGSLVLTDEGLIPIENVHCGVRVWDGIEWVQHDGVVCRGYKEVITYEGLTATPDHIVWTDRGVCELQQAVNNRWRLLRSGDGREAIRVGENNQPIQNEVSPLLQSIRKMSRLWNRKMDLLASSHFWKIKRLSEMLTTQKCPGLSSEACLQRSGTMPKSKRQKLSPIWRAWDRVQILRNYRGQQMDRRESWSSEKGVSSRPDRQQWALRTGKPSVGDSESECKQQKKHQNTGWVQTIRVAIRRKNNQKFAWRWSYKGRDNSKGQTCCSEKDRSLEGNTAKVRVYDILNCGPRNRFTANDVLVHNCGYGGGVGAVEKMDNKKAIAPEDRKKLVKAWREASPNIVQLWWDMDEAATKAVNNPGAVYKVKKGVYFVREKGFLFMGLPSGRRLAYPRPMMVPDEKYNRMKLTYEGTDQYTRQWTRISTYGPKLVENCIQAICRDLLAYGMQKVANAGHDIVLHVHDECIVEAPGDVSVETIEELLATLPEWAEGMPHRADGFETLFYRKDG